MLFQSFHFIKFYCSFGFRRTQRDIVRTEKKKKEKEQKNFGTLKPSDSPKQFHL